MGSDSYSPYPLLLIGAGGHSKVVVDIARENSEFELVGLIDSLPVGTVVNGAAVVGNDQTLLSFFSRGVRHAHVAIGDNRLRIALAQMACGLGFELVTLTSPDAKISPSSRLGAGVVLMGGTVINAEAELGDLTIVNTRASVDHDCKVGRGVHIAPGATLAGSVIVGDRCFIGAGATIIPGVTLGDDVVVGAGACVIRDVPSNQTVVGVPARINLLR